MNDLTCQCCTGHDYKHHQWAEVVSGPSRLYPLKTVNRCQRCRLVAAEPYKLCAQYVKTNELTRKRKDDKARVCYFEPTEKTYFMIRKLIEE